MPSNPLPSMSALGYRVWKDYFENKKTLEETIQIWKYQEHAYARRQLTWFKKESQVNWFDITNKSYLENIEILVSSWYHNLNDKKN